jgi:signal transduction histidine kinase
MLPRMPIESSRPLVVFAASRLAIVVVALVATIVLGFPYEGRAAALLGAVLLPWSLGILVLARRGARAARSPLVPAGDFAGLVLLEALAPDTLGAVDLAAMFLIACHAHFEGERRGLAIAALGSGALVIAAQLRGSEPVDANLLALYESVFVVASLATAFVVGTLRSAESASRLRARRLSRRTLQAENEVRRKLAQALHDGPVQELIGLDMILSAAEAAAEEGRWEEARELFDEAHELATRNIAVLRDEIVELGPYAFEELSLDAAIERCLPTWRRRYGFEVMLAIERIDLPPEIAGAFFWIAHEAVINAGRHSGAEAVSLSVRQVGSEVELRVTDNGRGFQDADPLGPSEPGHLGLASMRERAELLDGTLDIETSELGTRVLVRAPLRPAPVRRGSLSPSR